jgi:hypothetical protein
MYSRKFRYHHPEGYPVPRLAVSYTGDCWDLIRKCLTLLGPIVKHFSNSDHSYNEIIWSWETKEKYQECIEMAGTDWQKMLDNELQYMNSIGVTQVRFEPGYDVLPSDDMIETPLEELSVIYKAFITQPT